MSPQNLLYVFQQAPYASSKGAEGLDAVLIGAAFEQHVSLLFVHDGVFQLRHGQDTAGSGLKQTSKTFAALNDLGVENMLVHDQSLRARGLDATDLMLDVTELDREQIAQVLQQQFRVFTF